MYSKFHRILLVSADMIIFETLISSGYVFRFFFGPILLEMARVVFTRSSSGLQPQIVPYDLDCLRTTSTSSGRLQVIPWHPQQHNGEWIQPLVLFLFEFSLFQADK